VPRIKNGKENILTDVSDQILPALEFRMSKAGLDAWMKTRCLLLIIRFDGPLAQQAQKQSAMKLTLFGYHEFNKTCIPENLANSFFYCPSLTGVIRR